MVKRKAETKKKETKCKRRTKEGKREKPNKTTKAAIKEGNRIATSKEIKGSHSLDELKKDLGLEVD